MYMQVPTKVCPMFCFGTKSVWLKLAACTFKRSIISEQLHAYYDWSCASKHSMQSKLSGQKIEYMFIIGCCLGTATIQNVFQWFLHQLK